MACKGSKGGAMKQDAEKKPPIKKKMIKPKSKK